MNWCPDSYQIGRAAGGQTQKEELCRLISEIVRLRELVAELDAYWGPVQRVWSAETRSKLVALEKMRILFSDERSRMNGMTSEPPPAPPDAGALEPPLLKARA
ncbi:hypothetical protein G3A43_07050 [Paraburkholderia aspalathi]|nr:hypothetical protein [Paraburkholderia aspalathi]MBK3780009.1 hypothetical protein [Paraburkholderia aspalathi]